VRILKPSTRLIPLACASLALALVSACDSGSTPVATTPEMDTQVLANAEVSNPSEFARDREPLFFPLMDIGLEPGDPRAEQLIARDGNTTLPSQLIDFSADGTPDTLLVVPDFSAGQTRQLRIELDPAGEHTLELSKQTQAEISHKVGGEWQDQQYVGGEFQNVTGLSLPPQYTDHSEYIRYEGPGIESDKVGYRIYLDWRNGFDTFGKKTNEMVLQDVGQDGYASYHEMADWGMDILKVGLSLGAGGYGFWDGNEVQLVSDVEDRSAQIIENGDLYSALQINYNGWSIDDQTLDMSAHLAMHAGSRLVHTRLELSESLDNIAIGFVKHPGVETIEGPQETSGYAWTYFASYGPQSLSDDDSNLGMAVIFRRGDRTRQVEDEQSHVSVMRTRGEEVEYYFLAAWDGEPDGIQTKEEFVDYLDQEIERLTRTSRIRFESVLSQEAKAQPLTADSALEWAKRLADSELERKTLDYNVDGWDLHRKRPPTFEYDIVGLQPLAYDELAKVTGREDYKEVIERVTGSFVTDDGDIQRYNIRNYNIDSVKPGRNLLRLYERTGEEKYKKAVDLLRRQLEEHPRTSEGAFWHKQNYPHQVWLDGVYMGMPFLAEYSMMFEDGASLDEVVKEFEIVFERLRDPETGLYYHAWDEAVEMVWADPDTGLSPHFWGRGLGWLSMALVDILEFIPEEREALREPILTMITHLGEDLKNFQDPETGTWFQIMDQPERIGNYRESSASAMFTYFYAKAIHQGYLPDSYIDTAKKAFNGMINEFVTVHPNGQINMTNQCLVAGLGFGRDGSYEYYMSEQIFQNDPKGNGPFMLAGLAMHKLLRDRE